MSWQSATNQFSNPQLRLFVDALEVKGGKPLYALSYEDARKVLEDAQAINVKTLPADIEEKVFSGWSDRRGLCSHLSPGWRQRPSSGCDVLPRWRLLGSKNTHDRLVRDLVNGSDAAFVFVNYTPSPEAQFPVSIEQCYAATKYVSENGKELGLDPSRLALAGDSVGGYTTAVVAQLAKERKGPSIRYHVMMYPVTDSSMSQPTYEEFADGPWLTKAAMAWFWDAYAPKKEDRTKTMASPLSVTLEQLKGLPPALVIVDENDILRDEGEQYARKLIQAGVEVTPLRVSRYSSRLRHAECVGEYARNQGNGSDCFGEALGSIGHEEPCGRRCGKGGCMSSLH